MIRVNTQVYVCPLVNFPVTSTLYVPALAIVAADQLNDFNVGLNTKKLGSAAPVADICAVYV